MPSTYSDDFRRSVIAFVQKGHARREAARVFGTSASFVIKLMDRYEQTGRVSGLPRGGARHAKLTPYLDEIISWIEERPDITLQEMARQLEARYDLSASTSGLSDMLRKAGYTYKKIATGKRSYASKASPQA